MEFNKFLGVPLILFSMIWTIVKGLPLRWLELFGQLLPEDSWSCKIRGLFYKPFLKKCGRNFQVALSVKLEDMQRIEVGDHVYIGHGCWIRGDICLEDKVMISPYVTMVSGEHVFKNGSARFSGISKPGKIRIGSGTWIAAHAVVTSGVTIGKSCLIGAGAVVTKDVIEGFFVGGIPAKVIGKSESNC